MREPDVVRLLLVEDDPTISDPLLEGLQREGFEVELAATGAAALAAPPVDLVLLDLGLPDLEGRVVCQELRAASNVPIIVVTARSDEIDRVVLLELGADDYVVKPFGFRELVARIRAVLRRVGQPDVRPVTPNPSWSASWSSIVDVMRCRSRLHRSRSPRRSTTCCCASPSTPAP